MDDAGVLPMWFVVVLEYPVDMWVYLAVHIDDVLCEVRRAIVDDYDLLWLGALEPRGDVLL